MVKRIFDIVFSIIMIIVASPLLLSAAIAIKLTSRGPVLYRSKRAGLNGKPFYMLKLRTMVNGADRESSVTVGGDHRITKIGKVLRKTKLDEFPQFWNIIVGDMSVVGPRPEAYSIVEKHYTDKDRTLLTVHPGLACPASIYYYVFLSHEQPPDGVNFDDFYVEKILPINLANDMDYINDRSFVYDIKIIFRTTRVIICTVLGVNLKKASNFCKIL